MARPKLAETDRKAGQVCIRLTPEQHARLSAAADAARLPLVEYCRRRLTAPNTIAEHARRLDTAELVSEVNRVGVNLNQIARVLNAEGAVLPPVLEHALAEVVETLRRIMPA